jgi:hypothetical protein
MGSLPEYAPVDRYMTVGHYKGDIVIIKDLKRTQLYLRREDLLQLKEVMNDYI